MSSADAARTRRRSTASRRHAEVPVAVAAIAGVAVVFFALPLIGLLWRMPWSDVVETATASSVRDAMWLSLVTSVLSSLLALLFGVPLAWVLARVAFPGRSAVRALCTLSMVLPPVVGGVALFSALGRRGLVGQYLDRWFDISLPFTTAGVVVAQTFVAMPFLVLTVESAFRSADWRLADAARTLGASRSFVFWHVTLPSIRPAVLAGVVLAWARALGEFGATITFAGNFPGTTRTMAIEAYVTLLKDPEQAIVVSLLLVVVSFAVLVVLRDRWLGALPGDRR